MAKASNRNPDQAQLSSQSAVARTPTRVPAQRGWGGSPNRWPSEFDRLFNSFLPGWPTMGNMGNWSHETEWRWGLDMDDREDKVVVRAEAPGFEKEDFDVQVNDNQLVMKARHQQELKEDAARQWHQEELFRTITLPRGIDPERVEAQYRNGVLTVTIPKTEQRKGQKIQIKS